MSNSDQIIQSIDAKQSQYGVLRNLVWVAVLLLFGYALYQGSADLHKAVANQAQQALNDAEVDIRKIKLIVTGRDARLTGHALDQKSADSALKAVANAPGIGSVEQRIVVASNKTAAALPSKTTPKTKAEADKTRSAKPIEKIVSVTENSVPHIRAQWHNGKLTLSGVLGTRNEMSTLLDAAHKAYPKNKLDNQIRIQTGLSEAKWLSSFTRHLPELKYQNNASMESSASQLLPKQPNQTTYVVTHKNAVKTPAAPANALALNTKTNSTPSVTSKKTVKKSPGASTPPPTKDPSASSIKTPRSALQLRSHLSRISVSGTLATTKELLTLNNALRMAYPPAVTLNLVQTNNSKTPTPWLTGLNTTWLITQPIEWLELNINNDKASLSGWVINDAMGKYITDNLAAQIQPIPVLNQLRSIQSQQHSVAAARMINTGFAHGIDFDHQKAKLSWDGHITVGHIAKLLRHQPLVRLVISVHTDPRGNARDLLYLSQKRANNIKRRLVGLGIKEQNLMAVGHGGHYPIADQRNPRAHALNQRVEFTPM